jgi:hypothetical protein
MQTDKLIGIPVCSVCGYGSGIPTLGSNNVISPHSEIFFFFILCGGTLGTAATTGLLYQSRMICVGDCGEICGMKTGRGNRSTRKKPGPAPLCPPQIPHD